MSEDDEDEINTEAANDAPEGAPPWGCSIDATPLTAEEEAEAAYEDDRVQYERDRLMLLDALNPASNYGLSYEILMQAMEELKSNPRRTIADAIQIGFDEWVNK